MSKYNPVSSQDEDLTSPSLDDDIDNGAIRYRDDPPEYGDSDDEQQYDGEDYNDEEIAIQPMALQAATVNPPRSGKCRLFSVLAVTVVLAGIVVGGKVYTDQNGVPESVGGLFDRMKGQWEDWTGGNSDEGQEDAHQDSEINELIEAEFDEERDQDEASADEQNVEESAEPESSDTNQETPSEENIESVVEEEEEEEVEDELEQNDVETVQPEEPDENQETPGEEAAESTEEEVQDEVVQEEVIEDLSEDTGVNEGDGVQEDNDALNYLSGATGTISKEWGVIEQVPHDQFSFTQGLSYAPDSTIIETTGLYGSSKLMKISSSTYTPLKSISLDRQYFGEGSAYYTDSNGNGRIIMLTWKKQAGFIYDADSFEVVKSFTYTTTAPKHEGWGITHNPSMNEFLVSDGSNFLYVWDVDTLEEKRKVEVTRMGTGRPQSMLNELEYMDGLVCCNIWHSDEIICVDPDTGKSIREYDFSQLWPSSERGGSENVLNGIAIGSDHVLLTGKRWDRMYKISLGDWPSLFLNKDTTQIASEINESVAAKDESKEVEEAAVEQEEEPEEKEEEEVKAEELEELEHKVAIVNEDVGNAAQAQNEISTAYSVVEQVQHDKTSFTQGLSYGKDGMIYETTGLYGQSKLRKINPETFEVEKSINLDGRYFGEGSTFYTDKDGNDRIIEITWKSQTGFIYDADTFEELSTFQYTTTAPKHEGWGITYDEINEEFIVSDGSAYLYFWDRDNLEEQRKVVVTRFDGRTQNMLNEVEFMDGLVCCNIWHMDDIICVDPVTGKSVREYDMSQLWPSSQRGGSENVLNGIAIGKDHILITGKRWDRMYKITFGDWPTLFSAAETKSLEGTDTRTPTDTQEEPKESDPTLPETGDLPDFFVPLTPEERAQMKKRLYATVFTTNAALLSSAHPSTNSGDFSQRTFKLDTQASKQFMHMHHMKTGGTSMDNLIHCAMSRQLKLNEDHKRIQYTSMSECGSGVRSCMDQLAKKLNSTVINNVFYYNDADGKPIMDSPFDPAIGEFESTVGDLNVCSTSDCGIMSYCASLHTVRTFGWKDVDKITVIRNPIDRAWSMYRFTLQSCYKCEELKDVLKKVSNGTFLGRMASNSPKAHPPNFEYDPSDSCAVQMIGHQATNLLSSIDLYNVANDVRFPREKEIVEEAVKNLRESFTWIGITDRLPESVDGFRTVFPFLAENLTAAVLEMGEAFESQGQNLDDPRFSVPRDYVDTDTCPLRHENAGRDPSCGTKEMDDETIKLILKLNNRDRAVYQAAVERFELQMEVLDEYKQSFS